ncbi:glycoside hydrolase family 78 protein [Favolaschia claudopus]|uniref:Glycoside hydrolase family 78 protein n=1 Tax=Favolaschia claudopus TaxID=2862362 RepID=A0AAV9ZHC7_9AGAR
MLLPLSVLLALPLCGALAPKGPWDAFNFAPTSKIVKPVSIRSVSGNVRGAQGLVQNSAAQATFSGNGSFVVLDWGKEVGGILSMTINDATPSSRFSFSFTESAEFISPNQSDDSCRSAATQNADGVQSFLAPLRKGLLTQTIGQQRGGFRFLTIVSNDADPLTISNISLAITFMPHWDDLRAYRGYFFAPDPGFHDVNFLTKLWYAGAYTVQTNTIDSHQARGPCTPIDGWANNASGGPVDGPILGDCGISTHTALVALNDLLPTKNALTVMFSTQDPATGALQYSGPPINAHGSDTYIAGDLDFVKFVWANYTKALNFLESHVDETGLANVPAAFQNDWGRDGGAGHNSAFNALLYRTLITASDLATQLGDQSLAGAYLVNSTLIKRAYNNLLWDSDAGMFRDNDMANSIHPQDGNSLAVLFNVTTSATQNKAISKGLTKFWTPIGPLSPELNDTIIPFVGGFEHILSQEKAHVGSITRKEWGYMLYTNLSVQSTLLEGFTANGSLGYRAAAGYDFDHAYTSHAHGWATGPTPALTFYVVGIQLTTAQGASWKIAPVLSGLPSAEGGLSTGLGFFGVKWKGHCLETPAGTEGEVTLPGTGPLTVDNRVQPTSSNSVTLKGGKHTITRRALRTRFMYILTPFQKGKMFYSMGKYDAVS